MIRTEISTTMGEAPLLLRLLALWFRGESIVLIRIRPAPGLLETDIHLATTIDHPPIIMAAIKGLLEMLRAVAPERVTKAEQEMRQSSS